MIDIEALAAMAAQRERLAAVVSDPAHQHRRRAVDLHRRLRRHRRA